MRKRGNNMITPQHYTSLQSAISSLFGEGIKVESTSRISGGDINEAYGLALTDGKCIFMKSNKKENLSFFAAGAAGVYLRQKPQQRLLGRLCKTARRHAPGINGRACFKWKIWF